VTTGKDYRLDRLASSLTAKERALLVLRAWKEAREGDSAWHRTMPDAQAPAFNHYVARMNGVNVGLIPYILLLRAEVDKLQLRFGMLSVCLLWQRQAYELWDFIEDATTEPVTASEYREREAQARDQYLPVAALAEALTALQEGWSEGDLVPGQDGEKGAHYDVIVRPEAWQRVRGEHERELRRLVAEGTLPGQGKGRSLTVQAGPAYDRLGAPVPVTPPWAAAYEVVPDGQAEEARLRRYRRTMAREAFEFGPRVLIPHLPALSEHPELRVESPSRVDEAVAAVKETLRDGVQEAWRRLRAVELVVDDVRGEFDGEDPLLPEARQVADECSADLEGLRKGAERLVGLFALEEPGDEELAWVRRIVERAG
jgi:hypothetical protein